MNETKPRLIKIPWKMAPGDEFHDLDTAIWFKYPMSSVRRLHFDQWGIDGPELGRGLCLLYDDNFTLNGSPVNRCIMDVTGGKAKCRAGHRWCGNVLGLRMRSLDSYEFNTNVDMEEDLQPFVRYFEDYDKVVPVVHPDIITPY